METLGADRTCLSILENKLSFDVIETPYFEPNNQSALSHSDILTSKVLDWESKGFVERLSQPSLFTNPMSVKEKYDFLTQKPKFRPCIDLSRNFNKFIQTESCKLDSLGATEASLFPGDFLCSFDLESMYFHVQLTESSRKYFGFTCKINGQDTFFRFTVMPFGLKNAVEIVNRICKPLKAFLHDLGICFSLYIDDSRISSPSFQETLYKTKTAILLFQLAGWRINFQKSVLVPTTNLRYLGFYIDTRSFTYVCPPDRIQGTSLAINNLMQRLTLDGQAPARLFAEVLGKIASLIQSHGSIVSLATRSSQHALGKVVFNSNDYNLPVQSSPSILKELKFFLDNIDFFNGQPIFNTKNTSIPLQQTRQLIQDIVHSNSYFPNLIVSDSSDTASFVYAADTFRTINIFSFNDVEKEGSSTYREMLAIVKTLPVRFPEPFQEHQHIFWQTDSQCSTLVITKGSRIPTLQALALHIKMQEKSKNFTLIPVWTTR